MSSYFKNARNFVANNTSFNTYVSGADALQYLYEHAATGAMHDSEERFPPPLCHPGTGEAVVIRIRDWFGYQTRPGKPIMWVHAPAGYGKTAIAGTISKMLEEMVGLGFSPLGATFFFWRTSPERNSPARFIITIAYQLAMSIPELAPHVGKAVERDPMILKKALEAQLIKLIVEPFKALGDLVNIPNRLVIIDGLDECINSEQESRVEKKYAEDQEKVQVRVLKIVRTLQSHHLPLSFLILSRPEVWIKQHLETGSFTNLLEVVDLYEVGDHLNDTEKYIREEMSRIASHIEGQIPEEEWPGERIVREFVRRTNGHMLYASTVIRHIDDPYQDPRERLKSIFDSHSSSNPELAHSTPFSSLYELYRQIMRSCPESSRSLMLEVLEDMVVTREYFLRSSLSRILAILDSLSGRAPGVGIRAIRGLRAVLRPSTSSSKIERFGFFEPFIHSSFDEFLEDPSLSMDFSIDKTKGMRRHLWKWLEILSTFPHNKAVEEEPEHLRFAVAFFISLWLSAWSSEEDIRAHEGEYIGVVKKLLTVDLATCFTRLQQLQLQGVKLNTSEPFVVVSNVFTYSFMSSIEYLPKESDPLAKQALMHVLSSTEKAEGRLLKARGPTTSIYLHRGLGHGYYLWALYLRSMGANRDKSEEVVQALKRLRGELQNMDKQASGLGLVNAETTYGETRLDTVHTWVARDTVNLWVLQEPNDTHRAL